MSGILARYESLVAAGELRPDAEQAAVAARLERLQRDLEESPKRGSILWRALKGKPEAPEGLYMWGGVGRGKSMLMDLFHETLAIGRKRRAHFHAFMQEMHTEMHRLRGQGVEDVIKPVARAVSDSVKVLPLTRCRSPTSPMR